MSSSCKPDPLRFGSDVHRLLLAAEAGQKADILTYYSGHLGPRSLTQHQPHRDTKQVTWKLSQSQGEKPNPPAHQQRHAKAPAYVQKKEMKESSSEFNPLGERELSGSRQDQATSNPSHAGRREVLSLPKIIHSSSNSLLVHPRAFSHKRSDFPSTPKQKRQFCSMRSDQQSLNNEDQLKTKQRFGRQFIAKHDHRVGVNVAEIHERKLQKELKKLSAQSWPHRDRLAVFSDVFDDVCESSPVFGRILREIKKDYDLYVNHMMDSQSPIYNMEKPTDHNVFSIDSLKTSLEDLGNGKIRELELEDAEKDIYRLEQEARRALEDNKRAQNKLLNIAVTGPESSDINTSLSGLQDSGAANASSVHSKRGQVLNMWREVQQLEDEIKEKLVCSVSTTASERCIKVLKTEIIHLIASNGRLKTTIKEMENKINMMLNREKPSRTIRRMLWDEIQCDLQTESE